MAFKDNWKDLEDRKDMASSVPLNDIAREVIRLDTDKVDKILGKGLSANDYTDTEKEKLAGLENYNDTEIKNSIDNINTQIGDIDTALDAILEIQSGLMGGDDV